MSASGPQTAEVDSSRSAQQSRPDRRDVESLEALWRPSSNDDGRATLEQLQSAVAAQGTSNGLNGTAFILVACVMHNLLQKVSILIAIVPCDVLSSIGAQPLRCSSRPASISCCVLHSIFPRSTGALRSACVIVPCSCGAVRRHRLGASGISGSISV